MALHQSPSLVALQLRRSCTSLPSSRCAGAHPRLLLPWHGPALKYPLPSQVSSKAAQFATSAEVPALAR